MVESRGGEVILGGVRAPLSSHCSLAHQQRLSPFTAEEVRLERGGGFFRVTQLVRGRAGVQTLTQDLICINGSSALPPRGWHAKALALTRHWGHVEGQAIQEGFLEEGGWGLP